jgi:hypothetical protein
MRLLRFELILTDIVVITLSLKCIWDPIDAHQRLLRGGSLKEGRADDRRTRRYKRGDHGFANTTFGKVMQSRIMNDHRVRTPIANTCQLVTCANIREEEALITEDGLRLCARMIGIRGPGGLPLRASKKASHIGDTRFGEFTQRLHAAWWQVVLQRRLQEGI